MTSKLSQGIVSRGSLISVQNSASYLYGTLFLPVKHTPAN
uniref:Uncharacterized protein n=1 Tax=Rhizophora mucronata TaxID=61149 RepID=A0A2P2K4F1_RHIMU